MKPARLYLCFVFTCIFPFSGNTQNWQGVGQYGIYGTGIWDFYTDSVTDLLYIAGRIKTADGMNSPGVFTWDGNNFNTVGCGIDWNCQGNPPESFVVTVMKYNGFIYAGGDFSVADGESCIDIAKWNGTDWDSVCSGTNGIIWNMEVFNNELYVMGNFYLCAGITAYGIAKFDGVTWSTVNNLPNYGTGNVIMDMEVFNGDIYLCGNFQGTNGCREIVKWDGSTWSNVGGGFYGGMSALEDLCIYQNKLYASGMFQSSGSPQNPGDGIAAWDGTAWSNPAGGTYDPVFTSNIGQIHDMIVYHNELYIAGAFDYAGGVPAQFIAKWDGVKWCGLGTTNEFNDRILALGIYHDTLYVGGGFDSVANLQVNNIAKWTGGNFTDSCGQYYVGIEKPETGNISVLLFPNPATDLLQLKIEGKIPGCTFGLSNSIGELVLQEEISSITMVFSITDLPAGIYYYCTCFPDGKMARGKVIISR
jgi:hypothetical protein